MKILAESKSKKIKKINKIERWDIYRRLIFYREGIHTLTLSPTYLT